MKKAKKIWWQVEYQGRSEQMLARTQEGAIKQFFAHAPHPRATPYGGWEGVTVFPVNGYKVDYKVRDVL